MKYPPSFTSMLTEPARATCHSRGWKAWDHPGTPDKSLHWYLTEDSVEECLALTCEAWVIEHWLGITSEWSKDRQTDTISVKLGSGGVCYHSCHTWKHNVFLRYSTGPRGQRVSVGVSIGEQSRAVNIWEAVVSLCTHWSIVHKHSDSDFEDFC